MATDICGDGFNSKLIKITALLLGLLALTGSQANASAIRLVNHYPAASLVEFHVYQGNYPIVRIGVSFAREVYIPTTAEYEVQAFTQVGDIHLQSNIVNLDGTNAAFLPEVVPLGGADYDLRLVDKADGNGKMLTFQNTSSAPVQFELTSILAGGLHCSANAENIAPVKIVINVDANDQQEFNTIQQWSVYAIANGVTSSIVKITDPNATVEALPPELEDSPVKLVVY